MILRIWGVTMATDLGIGPKIKENAHFLIWYMSFFPGTPFLPEKKCRGHGFLGGDTGFWQGTRVSGMPKHIKTHIKHLETHIKHLETHLKHLETHKNVYKRI